MFPSVTPPRLIHAMLSDRGRVRRQNEDACAANPELGVYVVCDGIGGAVAGEVASRVAAETFLRSLEAAPPGRSDERRSPERRLYAAILAANEAIHHESRRKSELSGMGTTLVALLRLPESGMGGGRGVVGSTVGSGSGSGPGAGPDLLIAHVGDSRCYRLRDRELLQLTADHSFVEEQLRAGYITPKQAAQSPMRNYITRAVGAHPRIEPDIQSFRSRPGDLYLLASDGLTRELVDEVIAAILTSEIPEAGVVFEDLKRACRRLIDEANANGGRDNITAVLVAVR